MSVVGKGPTPPPPPPTQLSLSLHQILVHQSTKCIFQLVQQHLLVLVESTSSATQARLEILQQQLDQYPDCRLVCTCTFMGSPKPLAAQQRCIITLLVEHRKHRIRKVQVCSPNHSIVLTYIVSTNFSSTAIPVGSTDSFG